MSLTPRLTALDRRILQAIPPGQALTLAQVAQNAGMGRTLQEIGEVEAVLRGCEHLRLVYRPLDRGERTRWFPDPSKKATTPADHTRKRRTNGR